MKKFAFMMALAVTNFVGLGCDEADKLFDCQSVCQRYKSCFDSKYDVSACRDRCKAKADDTDAFKKKADACESCIDERSCTEATFSCAAPCAGIIP